MVVINFLHVNPTSKSIPQCMWNRSRANAFVFRIKLLKHLLLKSCDIKKYFRLLLLLCNLRGLSAVEIFLALLLFRLKFQCCLHYVIINGKYQHIRSTADFVIQKKNGVYISIRYKHLSNYKFKFNLSLNLQITNVCLNVFTLFPF